MNQKQDLTQGPILRHIIKLSLPIIGTSFVQMAYNMIDMIWLGRVGSEAVAAVGTATFFTWLGISVMLIPRTGAEVGVAQSLGASNSDKARHFASNSVTIAIILAAIYGLLTFMFAPQLIGFFNLEEVSVNQSAITYLRIISVGSLLYYCNPAFSGIYNGAGISGLPFRLNAIGLILNIILDPIMIFGLGPLPALGTSGAAIATVGSQGLVLFLFVRTIRKGNTPFSGIPLLVKPSIDIARKILKLGIPVAAHSVLFAMFAMVLARIVAKWGALPIAIQSVGAQIEALSWMTAGGFATALGAFVGQNFGARQWDRIFKGFLITVLISTCIGLIVALSFIFFGGSIFSVFIPETDAIELGKIYLRILGYSQLFMCLEISTTGGFNGVGRTLPPSVTGIVLTGARIPLALLLSQETLLGLEGVWWSITISSILKGILLFSWFYILISNHPERRPEKESRFRIVCLLPTRIRQQIIGTKTECK